MWFIKYISCWGQYTLTLLLTGSYHSDKTSSFCVRDILSQSVSSRHYSRCFSLLFAFFTRIIRVFCPGNYC